MNVESKVKEKDISPKDISPNDITPKNVQSKTKKKRNGSQIRNSIIMICVTAAMLSSATYAWFTLSNQPKVTGLALTAGTVGGLKISDTQNGTFGNAITVTNPADLKLTPVIVSGSGSFQTPVYTGDTVTGSEAIASGDLEKYVARYTFWLLAEGTGTYQIRLLGGNTTSGTDRTGCFIEKDAASATQETMAYSLRVGLDAGSKWTIYEPNADRAAANRVPGTDLAHNNLTPTAPNVYIKQNADGSFSAPTTGTQSDVMFTMTGGSKQQVNMYIWIEGTDEDCVDKLQDDKIIGQIQFTSTTAP